MSLRLIYKQQRCTSFYENGKYRFFKAFVKNYYFLANKSFHIFIIIIVLKMSNKVVVRIKSAAFIRKNHWNQKQLTQQIIGDRFVTDLPVSESIFVSKIKDRPQILLKTSSIPKMASSRCSPSTSSDIWRKVHSTRSEIQLKRLKRSKVEEQPVRINLIEKVDRIKSKHFQRQQMYQKNHSNTELVIKKRCSTLQRKEDISELQRKIQQLLIPFQRASILAQERYQARLLRQAKK